MVSILWITACTFLACILSLLGLLVYGGWRYSQGR